MVALLYSLLSSNASLTVNNYTLTTGMGALTINIPYLTPKGPVLVVV